MNNQPTVKKDSFMKKAWKVIRTNIQENPISSGIIVGTSPAFLVSPGLAMVATGIALGSSGQLDEKTSTRVKIRVGGLLLSLVGAYGCVTSTLEMDRMNDSVFKKAAQEIVQGQNDVCIKEESDNFFNGLMNESKVCIKVDPTTDKTNPDLMRVLVGEKQLREAVINKKTFNLTYIDAAPR